MAKTICAQGATEVWHDLASFDMIWHVMGLERELMPFDSVSQLASSFTIVGLTAMTYLVEFICNVFKCRAYAKLR